MKKILFLFLLFLITDFSLAQSKKQWLRYADESYESKDYYGASVYYRKAMLIDSSDLYTVFRYAESMRQYNEYAKAEHYYQYVYDRDSKKEYKDCLFWLASMQKYNAKYLKARGNFSRYTKINTDKNSFNYKKAHQEIKSCEYALTVTSDTVEVQVVNMGDSTVLELSVNTVNSEFNAMPLNDSVLYFSSLRSEKMREYSDQKDKEYFIKVYEAERKDTTWLLKSVLDTSINKASSNTANTSISTDKQKLYISRCDPELACELYVSQWDNGKWLPATRLPEPVNLPGYISTQPSAATIDSVEVLFFVSDRKGGSGKMDIWKTEWRDGIWTEPQNLGKEINSIDDEVTPFYHASSNTLYFSSSWHYGLGGFDIFGAARDGEKFATPRNLGYPYNSSVNDLYYTINDETSTGFFTSNRKGSFFRKSETCCNDLWAFQRTLPEPVDTVPEEELTPLEKLMTFLPVKLYFHNDEPNPKTRDTVSTKTYLESYQEYKDLQDEYRQNYSGGLEGDARESAVDTINSFFEHHVDKGVQDLEHFTELLYAELEKGYKLDVLVKGHASALAKTDYNVPLTLRRISSLELYLRNYREGAILPYLLDTAANGGSLKIIRLPFGEYKAHKNLSDNLYDQKNSVYSVAAAEHRNIEIVSVTLSHDDSLTAEMRFLKKEVFDFGSSVQGQKLVHSFKFKNSGKAPLLISNVSTSCECITVQYPTEEIVPGEKGEVEVVMETEGLKGKEFHSITIYTNGVPIQKELSVTTEVRDR